MGKKQFASREGAHQAHMGGCRNGNTPLVVPRYYSLNEMKRSKQRLAYRGIAPSLYWPVSRGRKVFG